MEIINILLKTIISYFVLILVMRFMGKREIGQLNLFDLVILLTIVDLLVVGIEHYDENYFVWLMPIIILGIIQKLISKLLLKNAKFRSIIDGKETIVIYKGKMLIKNMKKNNYNIDDLFIQIREKNIGNIEDIEYAILEANGSLSVFKYNETDYFPIPIVVSGVLNKEVLTINNKNIEWFLKELNKSGYKSYKKIKLIMLKNDSLVINDDYK